MWKSGLKIDREWLRGKEKWLLLLVCGLILLILSFPAGSGKEQETGSPAAQIQRDWEASQGADAASAGDGTQTGSGTSIDASSQTVQDTEALYEKELELRVREILKNVEGVGEVDVMITLKSSKEKVIHIDTEKNRSSTEETDSAGGTRRSMTEEIRESSLLSGASGSGEPVIEKELQPEIAGIAISAQGGGSPTVKAEISEAMEALFGLPAHKIKVLKRAQ